MIVVEASAGSRRIFASGSFLVPRDEKMTLNIGGFPIIFSFVEMPSLPTQMKIDNAVGVTLIDIINPHPQGSSFTLRPLRLGSDAYELLVGTRDFNPEGPRTFYYTVYADNAPLG